MDEMVTRDDFERNLDKLLDDYDDNPRVETVRLYLTQIHAELDALRADVVAVRRLLQFHYNDHPSDKTDAEWEALLRLCEVALRPALGMREEGR